MYLYFLKPPFMKRIFCFLIFYLTCSNVLLQAQELLPKSMTKSEEAILDAYLSKFSNRKASAAPDLPVRTMAEWEEIKALTLSWQGFPGILTEIVRAAVDEVDVIIFTSNENSVETTLTNAGVSTERVFYIDQPTNSIWIRDYGQHTVYKNDVEDQALVDWIYNRPRELDNESPQFIADYYDYELYATNTGNNRLVNTGGNFMSDGMGTAFASNLILDENDGSGLYNSSVNYPDHTEAEIDAIMNQFMGINQYIKMETLPYDGIHHIDMHMKLLNEETLLIAEYPDGVADGPQIEENIQYILNNFTTPYGNPYNIIRIPSPPSTNGAYPNNGGSYRTYTNSVFINSKVLVPFYRTEYDTIAQRIYEAALPGYEIIGIDCDNSGNNIISLSGAIHCITKAVGVDDPLLINHAPMKTMAYVPSLNFEATAQHRSGIESMVLFYKTEDGSFTSEPMNNIQDSLYACDVSGILPNTEIEYYFEATSYSGKVINRPIVAPQGGYQFTMTPPSSQSIQLFNGWNLMSSYLNNNQTVDSLFASISEYIVIVKNSEGTAYLPDWSFNGIGLFNSLEGYFVKTNSTNTLNIFGPFLLPEENPITLNSGWSAISYLRVDEVSAELIFTELVSENNLVIAKNHLGQAYLPDWNFNGIGNLIPGQGYQLKVSQADTLHYLPIHETY